VVLLLMMMVMVMSSSGILLQAASCSCVSWCGTRLAATYLLHKVWVTILKKDVDTFASSAISWLLCLSSSDLLLTATTNASSSAINRLLLLYHLQ